MHSGRGYRGWVAAFTVAITLSLVFLAVEKHIRSQRAAIPGASHVVLSNHAKAIVLLDDPALGAAESFARTDDAPLARMQTADRKNTESMLRRPPEPAPGVVLRAPIAANAQALLPLDTSGSSIQYLMDAIDSALEKPTQTVSVQKPSVDVPTFPLKTSRAPDLPSPVSIRGRLPEPTALLEQLNRLQQRVDPRLADGSTYVAKIRPAQINAREAHVINHWIVQCQAVLHRVVMQQGLENPASIPEMQQLTLLAQQATEIGNALTDHDLAADVIRAGYALQRRVEVWHAIQQCLDGTTIGLARPRSHEAAKEDLLLAVKSAEERLTLTGDTGAWRSYLLLDELRAWAESQENVWQVGNDLALRVLSRLNWQRLSDAQRQFLAQPEFEDLAAHLVVWGREPIDYRDLLTDLEAFERDPISRVRTSLAGAVQVLRLSHEEAQQQVASAINTHYRNANIRVSISSDFIQRFLPSGEQELRPIRQRILGADTYGDSAVKTQLKVKLIPDEQAWNIDVGVLGEMVSTTRSSKGPAVFHNTSTAQTDSHRYVRLNPRGYQVTSEPTNVASQDYLRKMSTDFDGLPVIGDFVRVLAREQFDQKRGLAQRITRRIIAQETDAELDRRLDDVLTDAERKFQDHLVGPLEQMNLNPMVVSMRTTEQRLMIRYRVANETQMAASTPRPRAPGDSYMSMQLHESAVNNAIDRIGLSGRDWNIRDLFERLGEVFQQSNWQLPEDVPEDISIRFANTRPATVEMQDGRLRLTLRIAKLSCPSRRLNIERFLVTSNYIPVAEGLQAELVRDNVVEIVSSRDRLALRLIFAKVFVSRPEIPLISQTWREDPRAEGLAVSQLEIRDGWLAVAVSDAGSEMAAAVAQRARDIKMQ